MRRKPIQRGEHLVWLTGAALTVTLLATVTLIGVVMVNGLGSFWPSTLAVARLVDGGTAMGEITQREYTDEGDLWRIQFKVGNRDLYGADFRWIDAAAIETLNYPEDAAALEREEYGNFYGFLERLDLATVQVDGSLPPWERLQAARDAVEERFEAIESLNESVSADSREMERIRLAILELRYEGGAGAEDGIARLEEQLAPVRADFDARNAEAAARLAELRSNTATFADAAGRTKEMPILSLVRTYRPNAMSVPAKALFYLGKVWELLSANPRESNTEGGLFPAIFGTVMLVMLMSLFCIPLGVVAAVYLQEYAREGLLVRMVRIAVFNLAGVPSIVYGIFGLGFFVYGVGGTIDELLFPERLPNPTFGTGGILWASLTLALLTVPVVIVVTEEALAAIPGGIREASLSLGATRFQTLWRLLLPIAAPGIITGFVLSTARAAGEVAPLMITGVVKLAPALPLDGEFPFFHLDRKFMHLGFHIYDVGFQSPNVEAAKPMVFITTLLLLAIVIGLSIVAIVLRNSMQKRYAGKAF